MDGPERTTSAKQTGGPQWKSEQKPATNTKSTSSSQKTNSMNSNVMPKLSKPRPDHGQGIRDVKDSNPRSNSQGQRPQVTTPPKKVQSEARPAKESRHTTQYKSSQPTDPAEIALKSLNVKWEEERVQEGVRVIAYIPDRQFADGNHFQKTTFTAADRASALRAVVQKALEVPKQKYKVGQRQQRTRVGRFTTSLKGERRPNKVPSLALQPCRKKHPSENCKAENYS